MNSSVQNISLGGLFMALIPVAIVCAIYTKWALAYKTPLYAVLRMILQLTLIGYVLVYIFNAEGAAIVMLVLLVMAVAASWIALRSVKEIRKVLYFKALSAITIASLFSLALITQAILGLSPWFLPRYFIPLAGMIFANSMNSVSLAAERALAEAKRNATWKEARNAAFSASLIPITNACFAAGLVAIPGMMTGQILSGVSPLLAARYQIAILCTILGSAGMASALFLCFSKAIFVKSRV